jgi:thiosulfate/3-mercaptopyruvate sulfurtransferase
MNPTSASQRQPSSAPALPGPIIDADWLAAQQRASATVRIVDLRDRTSYDEGHLPGAVWLDRTALSCTRPDHSVTLVPAEIFVRLIGRLGITAGILVVAYDDVWGMHAARLVWALRRYGHPQAAVLSGGAESWLQAGRTLTCGALLAYPRPFVLAADGSQRADMVWLAAHQGDRQLLLLDVRGAHEYAAGHLPGARHWEWSTATPIGNWAMLRPTDELRAELQAAGITPERRIVTYCSSGSRAAHTYLLLRSLGYPEVRVLDDAWRARAWSDRTP